jgi:hypothetical protein
MDVDVNFSRRLPRALVLAALELREGWRSGVDLGQALAEKVEGVHLQHDERAAMLAEMVPSGNDAAPFFCTRSSRFVANIAGPSAFLK